MHFIEIKEISKIFNDNIRVLDNINLSIEKGQFIVLVGSSGCGKSTLLRIISGLETQTSGKILVDGECIDSHDPSKRDMAMVFQNYALYPHMTVRENLSFSLKINKHSETEINQKVKNETQYAFNGIHAVKISYTAIFQDLNNLKSSLGTTEKFCLNPKLSKEEFSNWHKKYPRMEIRDHDLISKKVCDKYAKFK